MERDRKKAKEREGEKEGERERRKQRQRAMKPGIHSGGTVLRTDKDISLEKQRCEIKNYPQVRHDSSFL